MTGRAAGDDDLHLVEPSWGHVTDPWDRIPGESRQAWAAFVLYRDMGPTRSHVRVAQESGKDVTLMHRWSVRWSWVDRCDAYDVEQDRRKRAAQAEELEEMTRRQVRIAVGLQSTGLKALQAIKPEELTAGEIARFIEVGVRIEAQARGIERPPAPR
jgi:hypothetical protein